MQKQKSESQATPLLSFLWLLYIALDFALGLILFRAIFGALTITSASQGLSFLTFLAMAWFVRWLVVRRYNNAKRKNLISGREILLLYCSLAIIPLLAGLYLKENLLILLVLGFGAAGAVLGSLTAFSLVHLAGWQGSG